jgi:hypothetical protein
MADNLRRRGGAASLLVTSGVEKGRTLAQIAEDRGLDPIEAAVAVIRVADPAVASFNMSEADISTFMRRPWVMTGSDASTGHPRSFGSFARKYQLYVRERKVLSLREFIDRSTTLAADTFGFRDADGCGPAASPMSCVRPEGLCPARPPMSGRTCSPQAFARCSSTGRSPSTAVG